MTLTIELKDEIAERATRAARRKGVSVPELVEEFIRTIEPKDSLTPIVDEILRMTEGFSLPADGDDKKEYHEYISRKHA